MGSLNRTMQYGNNLTTILLFSIKGKFKSYYVVWKLANLGRIIPIAIGLNRTMQYGNAYFFFQNKKEKKFKSYYVVWKLNDDEKHKSERECV